MNQTQALAKLKKILGPKMGYRVDTKAPDAEKREVLRAEFLRTRDAKDAADQARSERMTELLSADAEYQRLKAAASKAKRLHEAVPPYHRKRITVGHSGSLFFNVVADGDNWDEVVSLVVAKQSQKEPA